MTHLTELSLLKLSDNLHHKGIRNITDAFIKANTMFNSLTFSIIEYFLLSSSFATFLVIKAGRIFAQERDILTTIISYPGMTSDDIADIAELKYSVMPYLLSRLLNRGFITRIGFLKYYITDEGLEYFDTL